MTATVVCDAGLELGEGARWVDGRVVLVDILTGRLLELSSSGRLRTVVQVGMSLGAVAPVTGSPDRWIAAMGTGIALLSASGEVEWLDRPADGGPTRRRMNDGVCDPHGRFWAGSMAYDATIGAGALYRTDLDGTVCQVLDGLTIPNGPAFTSDGTQMYLADTARGVVNRYPISVSGELGAPERFLELGDERPDGMTVDIDDNLWVAMWGAGQVRRYSPYGAVNATISLPVPQPTSPCLAGADGRRLFITTAAYGIAAGDGDGAIFAVDVTTPGTPARPFRPR